MEKTMDERARRFTELEERLEEQPLSDKTAAGDTPAYARAIVRDVSWASPEDLPTWYRERKAKKMNRRSPPFLDYEDGTTLVADNEPEEEGVVPVAEPLDDNYAVFHIDVNGNDCVIFEGESSFSHGLTKELRTYPNIEKVGDLFETAVLVSQEEGREYSFRSFSVEREWLDKEAVWKAFQSNELPESTSTFETFDYPNYIKRAEGMTIIGWILTVAITIVTLVATLILGASSLQLTIGAAVGIVGSLLLTQTYRVAGYVFNKRYA